MGRTAFTILLLASIALGQIDKPVTPEDLADRRGAALVQRKDELKVYAEAEKILRGTLGDDPGEDPAADGPFIQLDIMRCLSGGDYSRKAQRIYIDAAMTAGQVAQEHERKSNANTSRSVAAIVSETRKEIDDTISRKTALKAKGALTNIEAVELEGLESLERQLRETLSIYERLPTRFENPGASASFAQEMRKKEELFRVRADEARKTASVYDRRCLGLREMLADLVERKQNIQALGRWNDLDDDGSRPQSHERDGKSGDPPSAGASRDEAEVLRNQVKDYEQRWSDLGALQKQLDRLNQIKTSGAMN